MANQIRIQTAVQVVNDNSVANEATSAGDYTHEALDAHVGSRSWGGSYNISTTYTDADVASWNNVVVSATTADGLDDSGWTEASAQSLGTIPANVFCVAVDYVKQAIGADSVVNLTINGIIVAGLTPGESIVIPIHAGDAVADLKIHDANYGSGTREAEVNVMIVGT